MDRNDAAYLALAGLTAGVCSSAFVLGSPSRSAWVGRLFSPRREACTGGPAILTWVSLNEANALQRLATDGQVAEFGAAFGYSTVMMAKTAAHVTSIDPHLDMGDDGREAILANLVACGVADKVTIVEDYSSRWCETAPCCMDLVFIDGDHSYVGASGDLQCATRLVKPGGTIAIHDYTKWNSVKRAVDDWSGGVPPQLVDSMAVYRV